MYVYGWDPAKYSFYVFYFHSPSQMLVPGTGSNSDLESGNARQMSQLKAQLIASYRGGGRLQHHTVSTLLACPFSILFLASMDLVTGHWSLVNWSVFSLVTGHF